MTAQCPDQLINHYPPVDFAELSLYRIYNGDIAGDLSNETYPLQNSSDKTKHGRFSACWKGFTRTYELAADGRLSLTGFEYPFTDNKGDTTSESIAGDFWLELRDEFFGQEHTSLLWTALLSTIRRNGLLKTILPGLHHR